ncbi:hypothetical protein [Streptomyces sp. NPDC002994]|uniref:hypothetical protein n=1 Tax=Streptomyces sp. NPDC002994 TaxID=3154441 RepID=UPI0033B30090
MTNTPEQREAAMEYLNGLTPDMRYGVAAVFAKYVETSVNFAPGAAFEGTLAHLQWAVAEIERLRAELKKCVGVEPTVAEESAYLSRCLDAVREVCDAAEKQATRWEHPLPVPEWVGVVREAADGERPDSAHGVSPVVEYGIRIHPDEGGAWVLQPTKERTLCEARLVGYRDSWPTAVMVQRPVRCGTWTEVTP